MVEKILSINPEKEAMKASVLSFKSEYSVKVRLMEEKINKLEHACNTDLVNFKKILVKFRTELDELNSFAKEGINGSRKTGSD